MALIKHKSQSVSNGAESRASIKLKKDQRVIRTRQRIDAAFVELLHRRPYGDIRVGDLTKKAGVGRATFYAHYSSKDELLRSQFERIVAPMLALTPQDPCPLDASALLEHVQSSLRIYKALMGTAGGNGPRIIRECFEQRIGQSLALRKATNLQDSSGLDLRTTISHAPITTRFVAASLFAVIECFIESGASESPQSLQAIFSDLVGGGLAGLGNAPERRSIGQSSASTRSAD